jgi:hypothetical protein
MHSALHTLKLLFTHDTHDILCIYAIANQFTHDMQDQILFTHNAPEYAGQDLIYT